MSTNLSNRSAHRMPRGRQTIRKGGSLTGLHGPTSRPIKLWTFDPKPNTTVARLEQTYFAGLGSVDQIEERSRSNVASGKFTTEGVKADTLQFALNNLVPTLYKARQTIEKAKAEVFARKAKLKIEGPDKSDAAAAVRRADIRTQLRAMKPEEQSALFARLGDSLPPELAMAIMEMAPEFSGVPKSRHDLITARAFEAQHGVEIAEISELEGAIAAAESVVEAAREEVRIEAGVNERQFNELAAPIEQKHAAPWLRRHTDGNGAEVIRVVDLSRGVERLATPEEIEQGVFYKSHDEYKEGRAA